MAEDETAALLEDDPRERASSEPPTGLPERALRLISDQAIDHAADVPRRDPASDVLVWAALGPRNIGGRIRALVQDPVNPLVLYAGSAQGGLWKSENGGDTWRPLESLLREGKEVAAPVGAIGLCHRAPAHLYVGTGETPWFFPAGYGLFYSSDGGAAFTRIAVPASGGGPVAADRFERILVDPWQPKRAWIAAPTGLWRCRPGAAAADPPVFPATADAIDAAPVAGAAQDVTDIAIDFGDRTQAAPPASFTVFAAVRGRGVFRAVFDTATNDYRVTAGRRWTRLGATAGPGSVALPTVTVAQLTADPTLGRIRLALCEAQPAHVYMIMGQADDRPSRVFHSRDGGARWAQRASGPEIDSTIAWYALVLEVHPTNPAIVVAGSVRLARSTTSGAAWTRILDQDSYDRGDRAQHADQHAALFDRADPTRIWSANDGGVSQSREQGGRTVWRKRSHGILAAQFYDVTVHPTFPFITGGGLHDNGTWVGFGGPSWYYLDTADGGAMGFEPGDPQRFLTTNQGRAGTRFGVSRAVIDSPGVAVTGGPYVQVNPIPDVSAPGVAIMRSRTTNLFNHFALADQAVFGGRLEAQPGAANRWIVARRNRPYRSTNGTTFNPLTTPALGANANVTAIAFAPSDPANVWWIGTNTGRIVRTVNGGGAWQVRHAAPIPANAAIADIAVHHATPAIVAVAVDDPQHPIFLSSDGGATWHDIGNGASAADGIVPSPLSCVRFDPRGAAGVGQPQTLYVGSAAGVYVARDVIPQPPGGAAPTAVWRTLNNGMPLAFVQDLAFAEIRNTGGVVMRRLLRAATFGRGIFELDLDARPAVRLLIRSTPIDDGHLYEGAADLTFDPRVRRAGANPQLPLEHHRAFDLRVDAPVSFEVGAVMDGAEFDEQLRSGILRRGDDNRVYVQVQNTGARAADGVRVGLYFASLQPDGNAPDLDADFWTVFPGTPEAGRTWQKAGEVTLDRVGPGQPQVAALTWSAPLDLPREVALLALASHPEDAPGTPPPTREVDPRVHGRASLVRAEARAALRVVPTQGGLFVRDAIDDTGEIGAVAWGARSLDIVVSAAAVANPDAAFASLTDRRTADRLLPGTRNHIYVRVSNRQAAQVDVQVRLLRAAFPSFATAADWQPVGEATVTVPADSVRFTRPGFRFDAPADVAPGRPYKGMLLLALIGTLADPVPDLAAFTDLAAFWRFTSATGASNNVACRALRAAPGA